MRDSEFSYDEVLYPNHPFPQTNPDRLAPLALLLGMQPAPPDRCRVLELGSGNGANLAPWALQHPDSEYVGVDLAGKAIQQGHAMIDALKIPNLRLEHLDLMELKPEFGQFDYILVHGLFSWVPTEVRDHILEICRINLAPRGIAYISFNALPGCRVRFALRDMLRFHIRQLTDPGQRMAQAVQFIQFLRAAQYRKDSFASLLLEEAEDISEKDIAVLFHDDLADINEPYYFTDFAQLAAQHGLKFLAEANIADMQYQMLPEPVARMLGSLEIHQREQYLDFIKCRRFRQTLLCHPEIDLNREMNPRLLREMFFHTELVPVDDNVSLEPEVIQEFKQKKGATLKTDHPLLKGALAILAEEFPGRVFFPDLVERAAQRLGRASTSADADALEGGLFGAFLGGMVEVRMTPFAGVNRLLERPRTTRLIRWQAEHGAWITTLLHQLLQLEDPLSQKLVTLLDGTRDLAALTRDMENYLKGAVKDPKDLEKSLGVMGRGVEEGLRRLLKCGILEA